MARLRESQGCHLPNQPPSRWRLVEELNITGTQRGVGRGGADFWAFKVRRGTRSSNACNR